MSSLRRFHNHVKNEVIIAALRNTSSKAPQVLDIGCGRGGDIFKYKKAGVTHLLGLDPCEASVEEAAKRSGTISTPNYNFVHMTTPVDFLADLSDSLDMITMFFCVHYLTRECLRDTLYNAHNALCSKGVVSMVYMEASLVLKHLREWHFKNDVVTIERTSIDKINVFIKDTAYFERESCEFLVYTEHIRHLCKEIGFDLYVRPFSEYYVEKEFRMTDHEKVASFMNVSILLVKI